MMEEKEALENKLQYEADSLWQNKMDFVKENSAWSSMEFCPSFTIPENILDL